jgi:hypothetical protein
VALGRQAQGEVEQEVEGKDPLLPRAERHYEPGRFTTFIGWECNSIPDGAKLHRVVFQRDGHKMRKCHDLIESSFDLVLQDAIQ